MNFTIENIIDPEVKEYFKEFASRNWNKAELARRTGFSLTVFYSIEKDGNCSSRVKEALKHLYKNPEGNYTNRIEKNDSANLILED